MVRRPIRSLWVLLALAGCARARRSGAVDHTGLVVTADGSQEIAFTDAAGAYELFGVAAGPRVLLASDLATSRTARAVVLMPAPGDTVVAPDLLVSGPEPRPARLRRAAAAATGARYRP